MLSLIGMTSFSGEPGKRKPLPDAEALKALPRDGGPGWNRLVFENSPYLQQHAANPVDWYPWGDEAFARAEAENKPIFLSIGYATCHWCHVMERESFEDAEVAALLNNYFISVKVDREERPDLDEIYMTACQAISGQAGWPLTLMLDHQKRPYFAGTYFPKSGSVERPGLIQLIPQMAELFQSQEVIDQFGSRLMEHIEKLYSFKPGTVDGRAALDKAFQQLNGRYDGARGGFGPGPKFPTPHNLNFLLRYWHRTNDARVLEMVRNTLSAMRYGGIYDHVGFGFHRYSVDAAWKMPHFEKMLYDQALLAMAYLETYQITRDEQYARTAREIFTYVLRDMTSPEGGFYSAEDAETQGVEGLYYLWRKEEIIKIAGKEDGELFCRYFNIYPEGNFRTQVAAHKGGNIIHKTLPLEIWCRQAAVDPDKARATFKRVRKKIYEARQKRERPFKDDKIMTDWNGLMIAALAMGGRILDAPEYTAAAQKANAFIMKHLRNDQGRLMKHYRNGKANKQAQLEDYAFVVHGLIELYQTTFESSYLEQAMTLTGDSVNLFWDGEKGGFFMNPADSELLLLRPKNMVDNALPSGNSVSALNLIRLSRLTGSSIWEDQARELVKSFASRIEETPMHLCFLMQALDFWEGPSFEVVIAGKPDSPDVKAMLSALNKRFQPNKVVILRDPEDTKISELASYTKNQLPKDGKATAYVCRNFACKLPTIDVAEMLKHLDAGK